VITVPKRSDVFKDFVFKAKAKDLQKKQGQGQEILKANAEDIQKPLPQYQRIRNFFEWAIYKFTLYLLSVTSNDRAGSNY